MNVFRIIACSIGVFILVAAFSCQEQSTPDAAAPIITPLPTTAPTVEAARALGFSFAPARKGREPLEITRENRGCITCHLGSDTHTMHTAAVSISCIDCHGGRSDPALPERMARTDPGFDRAKNAAHLQPALAGIWNRSPANPELLGPAALRESPDFIRFINPGDLRAARVACAACHANQVAHVQTSMMTHGAMLWGAALYNNGSINSKAAVYGEAYAPDGAPARLRAASRPTAAQSRELGWLAELWPLPRWEITQPGNILRVFEKGGRRRPVIGLPDPAEEPGRPDVKLSVRGLGTEARTDPVFIGLQKTRLLDPTLNLFGTNDHPGDYRASGCSACHVVYANDRSPVHSGPWARYGNGGSSSSADSMVNPATRPATTSPTAPPDPTSLARPGQPIEHRFVKNMPTSSCIVCHVHPGTNVLNAYLGFTWWDNESDGQVMYPRQQRYPSADQEFQASQHNPEGAAGRGLWSNLYPGAPDHTGQPAPANFLEQTGSLEFNARLQHNQFADFHGHGWIFRAVWKKDRHGNLLDSQGRVVEAGIAPAAMASATNANKQSADVEGPHPRPLPSTGEGVAAPAGMVAKMAAAIRHTDPEGKTPPPPGAPVHLKDIHLERGMQCVDCHFSQDNHGDGRIYGETRNPIMVECADCHGTATVEAKILSYLKLPRPQRTGAKARDLLAKAFTGSAAAKEPTDDQIADLRKLIDARFEKTSDNRLRQKSALRDEAVAKRAADAKDPAAPPQGWVIIQTVETTKAKDDWVAGPTKPEERADRARLARYAHTICRDGSWDQNGDRKLSDLDLAHASNRVSCYACHTSWTTSCFGCHLPMQANQRKQMLHNEGTTSRNYTQYNFQTLRDDLFMLGVDSTARGNKIVPVRSACAVQVSSQDALRQWLYSQQQTISAEGFSGTAFSPYFPHTVRSVETKQCGDCHLSANYDNNAILAQTLLQGTNAVNFIGRFAWLAEGGHGVEAVGVTEREEPQAVIGSRLHELAYPDYFKKHLSAGRQLAEAHHHEGTVLDVQLRGEYLYAACGEEGFIAYDVANIDNKGFSERIISAPVSPLGQRLYVRSKYATSICSPSTMALDPTRPQNPANQEQKVHLLYAFLYLTDREEGLIIIGNPPGDKNGAGVSTLLDGNPENNFIDRALTFNPRGLLKGASQMALHGHHAYICCDAGIVVLDLNDPLHPRHVATLSTGARPRKIQFQFRYGFVIDDQGLKVVDVTFPDAPRLTASRLNIPDARDLYLCRAYAYIAAGTQGLLIVDVEKPLALAPDKASTFTAAGQLKNVTAIKVGMTNTSLYAYVGDGSFGLKILQLTNPDDTPGWQGFSPKPVPRLIACYPTRGPVLAISKGLDRDRAVDEAGHQLSVFGRLGARPFTLAEQQKLFLKPKPGGGFEPYFVTDRPGK